MQMQSRSSRGATLRVQANLFERIIRVAKSYANALGKKYLLFYFFKYCPTEQCLDKFIVV